MVAAFYMFLYVPIIILIVSSFNESAYSYEWRGFSLTWYRQLWESVEVWEALRNSCIVAVTSVVLSLVLGLMFVIFAAGTWLDKMLLMFYGSLAAPEIVLAVGLLSFFSFFSVPLGLTTLIAGHTLIGLGYIVPLLHSRFHELNYALTEASLDLGADYRTTFFRVILPLLYPALLAGALLTFILSFDDFIISFFCTGGTTQTLPLYFFSVIRSGASPIINALSSVFLLVSSIVVLLFSSLKIRNMDFF
jgi:spermidine/putrescine transport system permease protein